MPERFEGVQMDPDSDSRDHLTDACLRLASMRAAALENVIRAALVAGARLGDMDRAWHMGEGVEEIRILGHVFGSVRTLWDGMTASVVTEYDPDFDWGAYAAGKLAPAKA